ncbi:MAG TPA: 16S rRNA (guanine(527)-N(7))-methyltransferase RsmG [Terriglobales bacterium]|nr:16S rRNA (guanine(527)-N(7))-methyltransferase RsmG [Terriglobales bacterium]
METARIAELLAPYLAAANTTSAKNLILTNEQLNNISIYIDILLRWNARMNLTAVREPEDIMRRHFGESLFTARYLFPDVEGQPPIKIIDVGSGAGFPGLPIKLWLRNAQVTLIEANNKKVSFLREVIRGITLMNIDVFSGRAESYQGPLGDIVTFRAVEKFEATLPTAARLIASGGKLAILIGEGQYEKAKSLMPMLHWNAAVNIPGSVNRILAIARRDLTE